MVVVGSGADAVTGALVAARQRLRTVVLEKTDRLGGTSACSGVVSFRGTGQWDQHPLRRGGDLLSAEAHRPRRGGPA
ncbi:FAD-dependent oxidoreductase [Saccharopolyspora tripterygii]